MLTPSMDTTVAPVSLQEQAALMTSAAPSSTCHARTPFLLSPHSQAAIKERWLHNACKWP